MYMEVASSAGTFEAELLNRYRQSGERLRGTVKNTHVTAIDRIRQEREDERRTEREKEEWARVAVSYEDLKVEAKPSNPPIRQRLTMREIIDEVAIKHGLSVLDIISERRERHVVIARHEAMWRCKNETIFSFPRIGKVLGGRDHSTVIHGVKMHQKRLGERKNG